VVDTKAEYGTSYSYMVRAVALDANGKTDPDSYSAYSEKLTITAVKPVEYAAEIDGVKYLTLADAIAEVEDGETIVILKTIVEDPIVVSKTICFFIDGDVQDPKATIVPGAGYKVHMSGSPNDEDLFVCDFEPKKLAAPEVFHFLTDDGLPQLQWLEVKDADYYYVYRTAEDGLYYYLTRTAGLEVVDTTAEYGKEYGYMVRAVGLDENGQLDRETYSDYSAKVFITAVEPEVEPLDAPDASIELNEEGLPVISWAEVEGTDYYYVFRNAGDGYYYYLTRTTALSVTDNKAELGTEYGYMVRAVALDEDGNPDPDSYSAYSEKLFITTVEPEVEPLDAPDASIELDEDGLPVISWDEVEGAAYYYVYRNAGDGYYYYLKRTTGLSVTDTTAEYGKEYGYMVRATGLDADGNLDPRTYSDYSEKLFITADENPNWPLEAPDVTLDTENSTGLPVISWDEVDGADRYYVYRSDSKNGNYYYVGYATDDDLVDTEAEVGSTYWYIVRAVALDANGKTDPDSYSDYSTKQSIVCVCARPDVTIKLNGEGNPRLIWDEVDGAERYYIYRSTSKWSGYSYWTWTGQTSIVNVTNDTYYYQVLACDRDGDEITYSAPSTPVCLDD